MTARDRYDVVIAGGGLAGLCLAIELKRAASNIDILVAEKSQHPAPLAAHKVGESSVELASHYFREVLGVSDLLSAELLKFGLRFLMSNGDNTDVATRLECGPSHFLTVPSFQIDRGQFENGLARRAAELGVDFVDACTVKDFELGDGDGDHRVELERADGARELRCRWFVDASGRRALLKKKLELAEPNRHNVNAVWFRVDHPIDLDDWSDELHWRTRLKHSRRLSTNHLMGEGYWVWLIPLAGDRTSVGIVVDDKLHPFAEIASFEKALVWLERHEPQCAEVVRELADRKMDFKALRNYSHGVKRMFSGDRWCLAGESGIFIDPFYSPGSDFIAMANGYSADLITRDLRGEAVRDLADRHDQAYRSLCRTYLVNYHRQYPLMGSPRVMTTKIVWDFVMYWGGVALIYFAGRLYDGPFMEKVRPTMQRFASMNVRMQALFRDWAAAAQGMDPPRPGTFVDYAELGFLSNLNAELPRKISSQEREEASDDEALMARLERNVRLAEDLKLEIVAEAAHCLPSAAHACEDAPRTEHLSEMYAVMRSE
ncbi:MAG: NAD(P)/FAD-dependent oxidoreductase [Deltaproteobacteria bacterium]|nr:NAD(P)/FAD-dependent oxidoreductase [Deltaproteobacteria bacterium]MBW2384474.1 NAD(P)/FAD-dependent oxidoreductase [Deltaproteobacteria bacterium]MBW2697596.1 NAD(P)/FAD-dependent oxidoreductase [Deltaproteobacteria bacterium]